MYCHFGCNLIHILIIFPESLSINQRKKMARISSFHLHIHFYVLHISLLPSNSTISVHIYLSRFLVFSSLFIFFNVITSLFLFILLPSSIFLFVFINKSSFFFINTFLLDELFHILRKIHYYLIFWIYIRLYF